jgi:integrase/recombinase XerD
VQRYLQARTDTHQALFVTQTGEARLSRPDIWRPFARCAKLAGLAKRVTPHLLRHTAATQLLFNGCPVGHIKEILGHEGSYTVLPITDSGYGKMIMPV